MAAVSNADTKPMDVTGSNPRHLMSGEKEKRAISLKRKISVHREFYLLTLPDLSIRFNHIFPPFTCTAFNCTRSQKLVDEELEHMRCF